MFMVVDENESWYLDHNIQVNIPKPAPGLKEDDDFIESNKMHGEERRHGALDLKPRLRQGYKVYSSRITI